MRILFVLGQFYLENLKNKANTCEGEIRDPYIEVIRLRLSNCNAQVQMQIFLLLSLRLLTPNIIKKAAKISRKSRKNYRQDNGHEKVAIEVVKKSQIKKCLL